jgi:hypothetical protein
MMAAKVSPVKDIVYTDFQGTGGILVDLNSKQYYQLNETGSLIWQGLEKGNSIEEIISEMRVVYDVSLEHAQVSVEKLLTNLETRKLISRS